MRGRRHFLALFWSFPRDFGGEFSSERRYGGVPFPSPMPTPLEDRLVAFAIATGLATETMPRNPNGLAVSAQLARCGKSPGAHYAEARESLTDKEYVYKMQGCLKELRESLYWIKVAKGSEFKGADYATLELECNELIAISVTCVKKAKKRL